MSADSSLEEILNKAKEEEERYDWLKAADCYQKVLTGVVETDFLRKGEISERLAYAVYKVAFQAENSNEFEEGIQQSIQEYEKAKHFYEKCSEPDASKALRCDAMIAYNGYQITSEVPEKKRLIDECWKLAKEALGAFKEAGDASEYAKTFDQLSLSADMGCNLESSFQTREKTTKEAMELGEQTLSFHSTLADRCELARVYVKTAGYLESYGFYFSDLDEERYYKKAMDYWLKANELSEETAYIELLSSMETALSWDMGPGSAKALAVFEKALAYGRKTKDKCIVGWGLDCLAYHNHWKAIATEDPDKMAELANKALQYAEEARRHYSPVSFVSPRGMIFWVHAPLAEHYWLLSIYEPNQSKKRDLLEKAKDAATDQLKRAETSGYPEILWLAHHVLSKILGGLAKMEIDSEKKKNLLKESLQHRNESIEIHSRLVPFDYWNRGMMLNYLADIKYELANLSKDLETSRSMLQEAVIDKENSLKLCIKEMGAFERMGSVLPFASLGRWQYEYGDLLNRLYESTNNTEHLKKSIEAFKDAADSFQKPNLTSRMAECYWKAAQMCNSLGEHPKASENFDRAANSYKKAAESIPQLKIFYEDHALYMEAWTEIEKARHNHARQEYSLAKDHFDKAAQLHKSLKQWSYLAPNYAAWAQVEHAEELSRRDQSEEALEAFQEVGRLFREAKKSLEAKVTSTKDQEENRMVMSLTSACDTRCDYCEARMAFEQARVFGKKGDEALSAEKYGEAIESLENIIPKLESEQDRTEFRFVISLSRAWEKMAQAEARADPTLYLEASHIFEEARDASSSERAKLLTLGHSRFCKALEAGTRFSDTRDPVLYSTAKQNLESAMDYYLKADFKKALECAKATGLLLDAYLYMSNASRESEPGRKAKLYIMTERVLQASAGSYVMADNSAKSEQVQRLLENVKEEREFALSLNEVLEAPLMPSTAAFPSPTTTYEQAVGLERLEHAEVQENLITSKNELRVGETLYLEIELVNPGRATAVLDKIEEAFPESFDLTTKLESYRVEGHNINMKGRRLDPLKTEEVKLSVKPKHKGSFTVRPRILYLDENGNTKSHQPEPLTITVKELGIKGWITGEA